MVIVVISVYVSSAEVLFASRLRVCVCACVLQSSLWVTLGLRLGLVGFFIDSFKSLHAFQCLFNVFFFSNRHVHSCLVEFFFTNCCCFYRCLESVVKNERYISCSYHYIYFCLPHVGRPFLTECAPGAWLVHFRLIKGHTCTQMLSLLLPKRVCNLE